MKNENQAQYGDYRKPSWAPPPWLFAPVWTVLYAIIAVSFGWVAALYFRQAVPLTILAPFVLNLIFNFAYTPLQFRLRRFWLAAIDVVLVAVTLAWALVSIFPYVPWVAYANLPYLAWVCFASALQITVAYLNRGS